MSDEERKRECYKLNRLELSDLALEAMRREGRGPFDPKLKPPKAEFRARTQKSAVAELIAGQRDVLQVVYDYDIEAVQGEAVAALSDLISHMSRVIGMMKQ